MSPRDITLFNALDMYIARVKNEYDSNWIITDDVAANTLRKPCFPANINDYFERVTGPENHMFTEICICMEGSLAMQMGEHIVDVEKGEACLILPGILHAELPKKDNDYLAIWISINLNTISLHLSGKNWEDGLFYTLDGYTIKSGLDYNLVITSIKDELTKKTLYYLEIIKLNVIKLLISILREISDPYVSRPENRSWKEAVVVQVQNYIEKNYYRSIRLSDISQELCISPNYINAIFKSITGKTIIHYVGDFKIDKARELLKEAERTISSIAFELGYYDQYHFSKIFKKETGFTPTQFRKFLR